MGDLRALTVLGLGAVALTAAGFAGSWWNESGRKLRRKLRRTLGGRPDAEVVAAPQRRAAGMRFHNGVVAVLWENGALHLAYEFRELDGAELIVDEQVVARVRRDEARQPLNSIPKEAEKVTLRLMFSDPRWPDFELDYWSPEIARTAAPGAAAEAIRFGRKWLSHVEGVLKRTGGPLAVGPRPAPARAAAAGADAPTRPPRDRPPWDEDDEDV